jgi:hypothetical protein
MKRSLRFGGQSEKSVEKSGELVNHALLGGAVAVARGEAGQRTQHGRDRGPRGAEGSFAVPVR